MQPLYSTLKGQHIKEVLYGARLSKPNHYFLHQTNGGGWKTVTAVGVSIGQSWIPFQMSAKSFANALVKKTALLDAPVEKQTCKSQFHFVYLDIYILDYWKEKLNCAHRWLYINMANIIDAKFLILLTILWYQN